MIEVLFSKSAYANRIFSMSVNERKDIYCLELLLSVGDISLASFKQQRIQQFEQFLSTSDKQQATKLVEKALSTLSTIKQRVQNNELLRIWTSNNPDDLCGMVWLIAQLKDLAKTNQISIIELPKWEYTQQNNIVMYTDGVKLNQINL